MRVSAEDLAKCVHPIDHRPEEFDFVPEGLETFRVEGHRGCRCNGSGSLGTLNLSQPGGFRLCREMPCECLYVRVADPEKVNRLVANHFINVRSEGRICPCLYCKRRRLLEDQGKIASISQN